MRILVCFKVLPEFETVLDADWKQFSLRTDISYARRAFNCFDESALEIALRLRDAMLAQGKEVICHAVTLGTALPAFARKSLYAVGFDRVTLLQAAQPEFASDAAARQLAQLAQEWQYDVILTGKQAGYADSGMVPFILSELLRMPILPEVQTAQPDEVGLAVTHQTDAGLFCSTVKLPVILSVGNSPVNALRAATLMAQLQAAKTPLEERPVQLPAQEAPQLSHIESEKVCTMFPGKDAAQRANLLHAWLTAGGDAQ